MDSLSQPKETASGRGSENHDKVAMTETQFNKVRLGETSGRLFPCRDLLLDLLSSDLCVWNEQWDDIFS